jgi:hypothetical protein
MLINQHMVLIVKQQKVFENIGLINMIGNLNTFDHYKTHIAVR